MYVIEKYIIFEKILISTASKYIQCTYIKFKVGKSSAPRPNSCRL